MPPPLRSRLALIALLGVFLIPLSTTSLGGVKHVTTCQERTRTPFSVIVPDRGEPLLASSTRVERGAKDTLCGGLEVNLGVEVRGSGGVAIVIPITNRSHATWRGTVQLKVDGASTIPVGIGAVEAGATRSEDVVMTLGAGSHTLDGSLLIGP